MLENYFTRGTGGRAPKDFRTIISYLKHQVKKNWYCLTYQFSPSSSSPSVNIIVVVHVAFFSLLFRSCTFPYSTNCSLFSIFANGVQCAAVDRCHSVAESRVSCFQSSEIDFRWAKCTWHRPAKVDSSSNRAGTLNMAVRMREERARPWVGVCVPLSLSLA